MKVWLKIIQDEKIVKIYVLAPQNFNEKNIEEYVKEICNEIDEPMPIFLNKHFSHLKEFSNTHFQARDFVESIYFDTMIVQIFDENAKKENKNFY